jgi:hypothetical protein
MTTRYGSRLMPIVVDETAKQQPDLVYASVPLTTNIRDEFKDITVLDIASATNLIAVWIDRTLGRSTKFDTIAYMGLSDLRYVVVFLTAVKCGYKVCSLGRNYFSSREPMTLLGLASIPEEFSLDECISS